MGLRTIISKQPRCKYCTELMETWTLFVPAEDQCHPECAGIAMAKATLKKVFNQELSNTK